MIELALMAIRMEGDLSPKITIGDSSGKLKVMSNFITDHCNEECSESIPYRQTVFFSFLIAMFVVKVRRHSLSDEAICIQVQKNVTV